MREVVKRSDEDAKKLPAPLSNVAAFVQVVQEARQKLTAPVFRVKQLGDFWTIERVHIDGTSCIVVESWENIEGLVVVKRQIKTLTANGGMTFLAMGSPGNIQNWVLVDGQRDLKTILFDGEPLSCRFHERIAA